jgi:uncharacterized membrane protein YedE/YeeE
MESIWGGIVIGSAVSVMLLFNGRVTGISGILGELMKSESLDKKLRMTFVIGLLCGGAILELFMPSAFDVISHAKVLDYIIAGFLVGFGTLMGSGCTSGHGVCGLSRFSIRSLVATITFIVSGIVGVILFKLLRGPL